eukprot:UN0153
MQGVPITSGCQQLGSRVLWHTSRMVLQRVKAHAQKFDRYGTRLARFRSGYKHMLRSLIGMVCELRGFAAGRGTCSEA